MTSRDPAAATPTSSLGTVTPIGLRIGKVGREIAGNLWRHWPLVATLLLLWAIIAAILKVSLEQNQGRVIYDVDDPYIHMAIAKNLVEHGVWGITRYEFSSSSSSIIWPILLVISYSFFGINDVTPLIINVIVATCIVVAIYVILITYRPYHSRKILFIIVSVIIFATPMPALVFSGHEHILHMMITIVFVYVASGALSLMAAPGLPCHSERSEGATNLAYASALPSRRKRFFVASLLRMTGRGRGMSSCSIGSCRSASLALLFLAPLLTSARYEGIFPVVVACGLFLLQRRWRFALILGALAVLPIMVYGVVSVAAGWYWLPNSIVLKGKLPSVLSIHSLGDIGSYFVLLYRDLVAAPHILLLLICALVLYAVHFQYRDRAWDPAKIAIVFFVSISLLHLLSAGRVRWFYRHDAYLVALGLCVLATAALDLARLVSLPRLIQRRRLPQFIALAALAALLVLPLARRGVAFLAQRAGSVTQVAQATTNIYQQQYQMGLFLQSYYTGAAVAANDVGAINYLADIKCLDLVGLASLEIAKLKLADQLSQESIDALAKSRGVTVAILYDFWFQDESRSLIPAHWRLVGQWTIPNNVSAGGETVSFYATDPSTEDYLSESLRAFAGRLPPQVRQTGRYVELSSPVAGSVDGGDPVPENVRRATP